MLSNEFKQVKGFSHNTYKTASETRKNLSGTGTRDRISDVTGHNNV